jgi:hypothetical protein
MNTELEKCNVALELDFSKKQKTDVSNIVITQFERVVVQIPLPSFGSSNSCIDLCADLLDASWALERLAACARDITATIGAGYFKPNITAILQGPQPCLQAALADCALLFREEDIEDDQTGRLDDIRREIFEYEDEIHARTPRLPAIVDWYFANLMIANDEFRSEAPDFYKDQMQRFPEPQVGFFRSDLSAS